MTQRPSMAHPPPIRPERVRSTTTGSFAFLPHRFLRDGFFASLRQDELRLYLFFVLAADRRGMSFYHYDSICSLLKCPLEAYVARFTRIVAADNNVKKASSKWIKTQGAAFTHFAWQAGYGAFAVSESNLGAVREYLADQREHHRKRTFQEEYRQILERHHMAFDERYAWD